MIGGSGEQATLKLVAQYGDYCNVMGDPERVRQKYAVLREHCQAVGRPYGEVKKTHFMWLLIGRTQAEADAKLKRWEGKLPGFHGMAGTPDQIIALIREYRDAGSEEVYFSMKDAYELESIRLFGETILPALQEL
jgi:alkanesulfonate monooxygenase SsuD/methylene tetrahydromethanopterin reductase-like flavin-dependent oxidoreductase (luciferase family)